MACVRVVESWWNGRWEARVRQRIRLREDGGRWSVEHDGPRGAYTVTPCVGERQARAEVVRLLTYGSGWRRLEPGAGRRS